jgi:hypothetical protein
MVAHELKPIMHFATPTDGEAWLETDGTGSAGLRLTLRKKGSTTPGMAYAVCLQVENQCKGFVDPAHLVVGQEAHRLGRAVDIDGGKLVAHNQGLVISDGHNWGSDALADRWSSSRTAEVQRRPAVLEVAAL